MLGVWVVGTPCRTGTRFVRRYQRCLNDESGRKGRCYGRADKRCVRPVFLGRCWLHDRIYRRTVMGYACTERRLFEVDGVYEGRVICRKGRRRISHGYTLLTKAPVAVDTEAELRAAWGNPRVTAIDVTADIFLRACERGDPMRESPRPVLLDGHGHTLRQTCFEKRLLRQDGTGFVELRNVTLTRGGSDGPGGAVVTRGEIAVIDSTIKQNLAEEPGGGVMSQRRATIVRSVLTGNLANDDGGAVYARRGGIQVYDSTLSGNLVDGSGGALGSTGDILVVRSHLDGNTTDGDGGAIYADEDGDVTVIDSTVSGSTADGPGGAIFTLDGDVTVIGSTLSGNRADDRGGAISGEASVTVVNSTISRNIAVAHVGGGIWSRGDLYVANSTVSDNYAEGKGGGLNAAGRPHPRLLHRGRQRRPGGRQHRRRGTARGVRLGDRARQGGLQRRPDAADRGQLRHAGLDLAWLQRPDRGVVPPDRAHRLGRRAFRPGGAARLRRAGRDAPAAGCEPGARPSAHHRLPQPPAARATGGRAAHRRPRRPQRPAADGPARRVPSPRAGL